MGSVVRWGLTEKKGFICVWRLAAEGTAECAASPGLCFQEWLHVDVRACVCIQVTWSSLCMNQD